MKPVNASEHQEYAVTEVYSSLPLPWLEPKKVVVPIIRHLDAKILREIQKEGRILEMGNWHGDARSKPGAFTKSERCGTQHCRAGWAIFLGGEMGYKLEDEVGAEEAALLIYAYSTKRRYAPNFFTTKKRAILSMERGAKADPIPPGE